MSQIPPCLNLTEEDVSRMLSCNVHLGSRNISPTMQRYVWKRNPDTGVHIIDLRKTWEKLVLAARVIVAMDNPGDVCAVALTGKSKKSAFSQKQLPIAQRAVLKFSQYSGSKHIAGRFTPGTFTNRIQSNFFEPRLLVVSDPVKDFQPILESSYVNMPVIAMTDIDSPTKHIDIAIPCNTRSKHSVALMWWMLTREVLRLRGQLSRSEKWEVMVDMFLYHDPQEQEKTEKRAQNKEQYVQETWKAGNVTGDVSDDDHHVTEEEYDTHTTQGHDEIVGEPKQPHDWAEWDNEDKGDDGGDGVADNHNW